MSTPKTSVISPPQFISSLELNFTFVNGFEMPMNVSLRALIWGQHMDSFSNLHTFNFGFPRTPANNVVYNVDAS